MEDATFVLSVIPPGLAILAEILSPISGRVLDRQSLSAVDTMGLVTLPDDNDPDKDLGRYTKEKRAIADGILFVSKGAVETAGLIPTWISVSTASAVVFHELANPSWWMFSTFVASTIFVIAAVYFFNQVSFLELSTRPYAYLCFGAIGDKCVSRFLVVLNVALVAICGVVWKVS